MGVFLRNVHIVLGYFVTAWLFIAAIYVITQHHYAEGGIFLAVADMYSYFIYVIIAGRNWPW